MEDEAVFALDLAELLELEGYAVGGTAANGPQALAIFQQYCIDLLRCDIQLQGPWDGIETARRLLAERPMPLVYLTALADRAILTRALPTAPAAYLAKPVNVAGLRAAIEVALRSYKPTSDAVPVAPGPERSPDTSPRETILPLGEPVFLKHTCLFVPLPLAASVLLEADNTVTPLVTTGPSYSLRLSLTAAFWAAELSGAGAGTALFRHQPQASVGLQRSRCHAPDAYRAAGPAVQARFSAAVSINLSEVAYVGWPLLVGVARTKAPTAGWAHTAKTGFYQPKPVVSLQLGPAQTEWWA